MACISNAVVIGGSIAGMSAAIALARAGVQVDLVELAQEPLGASLAFSGRAAMALVELGVYDAVHATGTPFGIDSTAATMRDSTGKILSAPPQRPSWPGAVDAVAVYRPVFLEVMAEAAEKLGVRIRKGMTYTCFEDAEEEIIVEFSDGESRRYDLLVGADGIHSKTRARLFPDAPKPEYAGQLSIRWMAPGPRVEDEGWYKSHVGRMGFYYLPQGVVYVPVVINMPEQRRLSDDEVRGLFVELLDSISAPAIRELANRLDEKSQLIGRPFEWIMLKDPWYKGHALLIGDAAHATSAHMGMGGGMALEDAAVLGQCIASAATLDEALATFMQRRFERVKLVVETSVELGELEKRGATPMENRALMGAAFMELGKPY